MEPMRPVLPSQPQVGEVVYGAIQPEYLPLPAVDVVYGDGRRSVITRWRLTWRERLRVLCRGCVWLEQLTFGAPLQPQLPACEEPFRVRRDLRIVKRLRSITERFGRFVKLEGRHAQ